MLSSDKDYDLQTQGNIMMKLSTLAIFSGATLMGISIPTFVHYFRIGMLPPNEILVTAGMSFFVAIAGMWFAEKT